ncbi:putative aldo-keto reductase [Stipitochalara longipes BDJ]|nr:putative aldo-keto reductase [Stipitochalara longipes BDJ]
MASQKLTIKSTLHLPNSTVTIPRLGFGVFESPGEQCVSSILAALDAGYRHIDTAQFYANETEVGLAIQQSRLPRSSIFVTTKIDIPQGTVEKTYQSCLESVRKIDGEGGYVDLFLVHTADIGSRDRREVWAALERLYDEGKAKAIGVSNYGIGHVEEMKGYAKIWPPMVNQNELHPWCQQREIVTYCQKHGIVNQAYSPLAKNTKADDPTLKKIAKTHNVATTQVLIRYALQKGWTPLPKSVTPSRIVQNADVYGFELTKEEMEILDGLDQGASGALLEAVSNDLEIED